MDDRYTLAAFLPVDCENINEFNKSRLNLPVIHSIVYLSYIL